MGVIIVKNQGILEWTLFVVINQSVFLSSLSIPILIIYPDRCYTMAFLWVKCNRFFVCCHIYPRCQPNVMITTSLLQALIWRNDDVIAAIDLYVSCISMAPLPRAFCLISLLVCLSCRGIYPLQPNAGNPSIVYIMVVSVIYRHEAWTTSHWRHCCSRRHIFMSRDCGVYDDKCEDYNWGVVLCPLLQTQQWASVGIPNGTSWHGVLRQSIAITVTS